MLPIIAASVVSFSLGEGRIIGGDILSITPTIKSLALGGAGTAGFFGGSVFSNPAGLPALKNQDLNLSYVYWQKNVSYSGFSYAYPLTGWPWQRVVSISSRYLYLSRKLSMENILPQPAAAAATAYTEVSLAYAQNLGDWKMRKVMAGLKLNFLLENNKPDQKKFYTADIGFLYSTPVENLNLALSAQNIGQKINFIEEGNRLPRLLKLGSAYTLKIGQKSSFDFLVDLNVPNHYKTFVSVGGELKLRPGIALRAGYQSRREEKIEENWKTRLRSGVGFSKGGGRLDYTYASGELLGKNEHALSLGVSFGSPTKDKDTIRKEEKIAFYLLQGDLHRREGDLMVAAGEYKNVINLDSQNKKAKEGLSEIIKSFYVRAKDSFEGGSYEESLMQWERILQIFPEHKGAKSYFDLTQQKIQELKDKKREEELKEEQNRLNTEQRKKELKSYDIWDPAPQPSVTQEKGVINRQPKPKKLPVSKRSMKNGANNIKKEEPLLKEEKNTDEPKVDSQENIHFINRNRQDQAEKSLTKGIGFYEDENYLEALKEFGKVLRLDPSNGKAKEYLEKVKIKIEK
ncbi:MAG: PorV/PorQ family protein [Elusimicrobiota bacterium]